LTTDPVHCGRIRFPAPLPGAQWIAQLPGTVVKARSTCRRPRRDLLQSGLLSKDEGALFSTANQFNTSLDLSCGCGRS